ncbi:glycosyltransferase family 4 protein [Cellvibrio fibrivorans]|uniref:Glycosyltransferase involved in cell wall biosynthesis n=1 Tax=Cellvibrio fibrivorans TaxID=126350 RepID=A0ABU1UU40_9GAMM|nr:glycosyltransferase family 4 protein [Cellvibrio fibrivorans]MDR7088670.1 glycosyltransferase involved in cell wall biosynthesis [Cellvibrio fibrivorans]
MTDKKHTIIHAIDTTGPGGAETVFLDIAQQLQLENYDNLAIIKGPGWVEAQLKQRSIRYHILKPYGFFAIPYYWQLYKLLKRENAALVHAHLLGSTLTYSILCLFMRIPLIATLHGRVDINPNERFVAIKQKIMRMGVSQLIAVSRDLAQYIQARGLFSANAIAVIYNGVEQQRYHTKMTGRLRSELNIPADAILIGSLGNIRPAKNYQALIDAVAELKNPKLHFVIAGHQKKDLMEQLNEQMHRLGVTAQMHFIGFYDNTPEFLAQMDLFVLSSSSEGFSIATIEAMASHLPVIATRCGGPEEILTHNSTGYLVPVNSPVELAAAIKYLLSNPGEAARLARAGYEHMCNTFSLSVMLSAYKKHYSKLLGIST